MLDFFNKPLADLDPAVAGLIDFEAERQVRKLILIPSESQAPAAVREALGSVFQNIYAEGYPGPELQGASQEIILDYEYQLSHYLRYSDLRYYKGVEYVNILEALAKRRAAEAFTTERVPPEEIFANVQPLSGSPANSAIYSALVTPGSTVMGMDLLHGGHLTHGSPVNRSGKLYNIVSYGIDPKTELLDYDAIEELARKHNPKMIIAGYTSYPWMPDWARFRQIADKVGAYLLADISHIAGMVAAGVVPSPVGYADVISFTTHKTLYGPRGACILSTDNNIAKKIDSAVFPGEQGGPHVNAIAGMAVAFELARTPEFRKLQEQVVKNASHLAAELEKQGLRIPHGGTDTHMLLVDCKSVRAEFGVSPDGKKGTPLMGDVAARILDIAGLVLNRNTIPGDKSAKNPSGVRMGTPWITQRGFREPEIERLAEIMARVIKASKPYSFPGRQGPIYRAKIDFDILETAKRDVVDLAKSLDLDESYCPSGYPHHYFMYKPTKDPGGEWDIIEIEGLHARGFCNVVMTNDVYELGVGESQPTWILDPDGKLMSSGVLKRPGEQTTCFRLIIPKTNESRVAHWMRSLSDGFVHFDNNDLFAKTPGPVTVRRLPHELADEWKEKPLAKEVFSTGNAGWAYEKVYWIGKKALPEAPHGLKKLPAFSWEKTAEQSLKRTSLYDIQSRLGTKFATFAEWELPLHYTSVKKEHQAVREKAGLFDLSHLGMFEISGDNVYLFLNTVTTNDVTLLNIGEAHYSFLLDHKGDVIDEIYLYRLEKHRFWMVGNSVNVEKDWAWLNAVRDSSVMIDTESPWLRALGAETVSIRNIREETYQLAIQGPHSQEILLSMLNKDDPFREQLLTLKRNEIIHGNLKGIDLYISSTGHTGEPIAYEMFFNPAGAPALWEALMKAGKTHGIRAIGMRAWNSLRIEAGLPRYGNELAGPLNLNPADAGFGPYVKLYKPFFIGKSAYMAHELERNYRLIRFQLEEMGARIPKQGDIIAGREGLVVGTVTSCSFGNPGQQTGLAYVDNSHIKVKTRLGIFQSRGRNWSGVSLDKLKPGDHVQMHDDITVIRRFFNKKE